jgi:nucleotide-binding universal stress UspA family protein
VRVVWVNTEPTCELGQHIPGADIPVALGRHGVKCQATEQVSPRAGVGETLLACARHFEADLLAMGCYGHARPRECVFDRASRHVLAHMSVPVLMSH